MKEHPSFSLQKPLKKNVRKKTENGTYPCFQNHWKQYDLQKAKKYVIERSCSCFELQKYKQ